MPAAVAVILLALACSQPAVELSGRERDARAVVGRSRRRSAERDGTAACAELSAETSSELEQDEGKPCRRAILGLGLPGGTRSERRGDRDLGRRVAAEGGTLFLDQGPDGWEISAAGCRPSAPDQPFECELEG